ncbi:hypothetical protein L1F30_16880 [Simiduia sp. 21SJ11W-1]|uniref:hypothetical protein n=1 Tax=Simiduia sp. 21SJ11W-1 TaxID=2909669 RepID=UPI0020A214EB|nr:hypothetical protein [Simiduia sp. 21SJ11W-1]UTA47816.1 hypothetical protein L1F30_16880 [Simiduia sp. 21SJ11W-1]
MQRYVITLLVVMVLALLGLGVAPKALAWRPDPLLVLPMVFGYVVLVCLFLERAIEVFLSALRGGGADRLDQQLQSFDAIHKLDTEARAEFQALQLARADYRSHSRLIAQQMGLCMGLLIALVGLRILEQLVVAPPAGLQGRWFTCIDILLTGSVLAGGSDAVNKLTKAYSQLMASMANKRINQ